MKIWKNANNAITCNLDLLKNQYEQVGHDKSSDGPDFKFAIVRDPLMRFLSAYSEISWWCSHDDPLKTNQWRCGLGNPQTTFLEIKEGKRLHSESWFDLPSGSSEQAQAFIVDLFSGRLRDRLAYNHVRAQMGTISMNSNILIMGNLSNMDGVWTRIQKITGVTSAFNKSCGLRIYTDHRSNNPSRVAMQNLLEQKPTFANAIKCAFFLPDMFASISH